MVEKEFRIEVKPYFPPFIIHTENKFISLPRSCCQEVLTQLTFVRFYFQKHTFLKYVRFVLFLFLLVMQNLTPNNEDLDKKCEK